MTKGCINEKRKKKETREKTKSNTRTNRRGSRLLIDNTGCTFGLTSEAIISWAEQDEATRLPASGIGDVDEVERGLKWKELDGKG
ncbi:hypothetical protein WR25_10844 [Diploscapter pachys]|uniref:Uncharacterized protein n=1 Tax=Diploscapter pachys TaxID=2018661 RepID=A0A2A2LB97_9BILA|nr:hypothetical protein WR25_10844 [Diploscapter pachys]